MSIDTSGKLFSKLRDLLLHILDRRHKSALLAARATPRSPPQPGHCQNPRQVRRTVNHNHVVRVLQFLQCKFQPHLRVRDGLQLVFQPLSSPCSPGSGQTRRGARSAGRCPPSAPDRSTPAAATTPSDDRGRHSPRRFLNPVPSVATPCGSRSISNVSSPRSANAPLRPNAVVVFLLHQPGSRPQ